MLLSIQFPLSDARKFVEETGRLDRPEWPLPDPTSEFIRFFGPVRDRKLGGVAGWIGEDRICKADRAISFSKPLAPIMGLGRNRIIFRRFYFDGWAVGKLEIGFKNNISRVSSQFQLVDLVNHILCAPVRIRNGSGTPVTCELAQAGKHIANLYQIATTPTNKPLSDKDKWQVRSGIPLLFTELNENDNIEIPEKARRMELPNLLSDLKLFHYPAPYRGGSIYTWILQVNNWAAQKNIARNLRLSLLRLHAEHECLRLILQSIAKKDIVITRGTVLSDELQMYLDKATKRITRYESKTSKLLQNDEIAQVARQSLNAIRPGQLSLLLESVDDYRKYLQKLIAIYAKQDATTINNYYTEVNVENKQGNTYNLSNFQAGILNIESTMTNVTQNVGNIPNMDQSTKDELKQLIEQLNIALQKVPVEKVEEAEAVADTAKDLVENISKDKPNKAKLQITLAGLKQAAENIANVIPDVLPVAIQIASAVSKSFGLG